MKENKDCPVGGYDPVVDKVGFLLSKAVTCFGDVLADIFDLIFEKVTFVESEAD